MLLLSWAITYTEFRIYTRRRRRRPSKVYHLGRVKLVSMIFKEVSFLFLKAESQ